MSKFIVILAATFSVNSAFARYFQTFEVQTLPQYKSISCGAKAVLKNRNGINYVNISDEDDMYSTIAYTYELKGQKGNLVTSAKVITVKKGWFPKCALELK